MHEIFFLSDILLTSCYFTCTCLVLEISLFKLEFSLSEYFNFLFAYLVITYYSLQFLSNEHICKKKVEIFMERKFQLSSGKNQADPTMFSTYRSESLVKICSLLRSANNFLFVGPSNNVFKIYLSCNSMLIF
jgi:hypothetical protein